MRKISSSGKYRWSTPFSSREEGRSRPKGFSTTTRAPPARPAPARPEATSSNRLGGMAR